MGDSIAHDATGGSSAASSLGSKIRMRALRPFELPPHPELASLQSSGSPPDLRQFVTSAIEEAHGFVKTYLPKHFQVKSTSKQSPPASAPVELLSHEINVKDLPIEVRSAGGTNETWFARTSVHENAAKAGSASWDEFDGGLRADHSQHEMEYTPDVYDANRVLDWEEQLASIERTAGEWSHISLNVMEMAHKIPGPLNNRVFPVAVLTAKNDNKAFIVVQIPVDTSNLKAAKYNKAPKITTGMYCSIEYGEIVDNGAKVSWQMATASDAKGSLPMWAQKLGVPGAVVKDVGLFIQWCDKRRTSAT